MREDIEYEKFTQEIYQDLLREEGLTTQVLHNVKMRGKATSHQIDVYWEYKIAGVQHKVAIECKNYNSVISIGRVRDFHSVLIDIGNTNGIMVTRNGYQKGAKEFAELYGINLMVLREPVAEDWKGRIKTITTNIHAIGFEVENWYVEMDLEWFREKFDESAVKDFKATFSGINGDIWITDDKGNRLKNFLQLQEELPYNKGTSSKLKHYYPFENGYISTKEYGEMKIKGVQLTYYISVAKSQLVLDSQKMTKAIVKNVLSGEMKFIKSRPPR
jgi:hypothetical protein